MIDPLKLGEQIERIVLNRIASDRLSIPTMPAAASACLQLLSDPQCPLTEIAGSIERDPLLAVQVLRGAHSAAYYNSESVNTLLQAVTRLGIDKTRSLLIEVSARRLFQSRDSEINRYCRGLWEHSIAVGIMARDLAAFSGSTEGEAAYLAGLLHDVGKPVMAAMLLETEKEIAAGSGTAQWIGSTAWIAAIQRTHRMVAATMAEKWRLPLDVKNTIRECGEYDNVNRASAGNFVRFANAFAKLQGIYVGETSKEDAEALVMVGRSLLGLDDAVIKRLSVDLRERVKHKLY